MDQEDDDKKFHKAVAEAQSKGELPTDLGMGAATLHEFYGSYIEAGFTMGQAIYLCGVILTGNPGQITGR